MNRVDQIIRIIEKIIVTHLVSSYSSIEIHISTTKAIIDI